MDEELDSPPLEKHVLDMVVPEIRKLFDDILKYRVDPAGLYYGITQQALMQQIAELPVDRIVALDSEYRYERKGHMYDPTLQSFVQGDLQEHDAAEVASLINAALTRKEEGK